jgi:hypothetical protein
MQVAQSQSLILLHTKTHHLKPNRLVILH